MKNIRKLGKTNIFSKHFRHEHMYKVFLTYQKRFREIHNEKKKADFTQSEYDTWNDYIKEDWSFRPRLEDVANNRQFDVYRFENLECSCMNKNKLKYNRPHLIHDLAVFFKYLPLSEIKRLSLVLTWILKEAIKNYGALTIPGFGTFAMFDKPIREKRQAFNSKKWAATRHRLCRSIEFYPSISLMNIVVPRDVKFMGFEGRYNKSQYIPSMFDSFVDEKIHRRRGRLFFQNVFDKQWTWMGYSKEYIKEQMDALAWDSYYHFDDLLYEY